MKNNFLSEIIERGYFHKCTENEKLESYGKSNRLRWKQDISILSQGET